MRRATLKAVAEALGVVPSTVSNAYNRPALVSPELRERIFEAAERLGYAGPDPMARGLRRGRSGAIGIVHHERLAYAFSDPVASLFLQGLASSVEASGQGLLLVPRSGNPAQDLLAVRNAAVDAFVVHCLDDADPVLQAVLLRRLPTVFVDRPGPDGLPSVQVEDEAGARAAAAHLLELGHRRLGVVSLRLAHEPTRGFADRARLASATNGVARARLLGYAAALSSRGLDWDEHVAVVECDANTPAAGRAGADLLLGQPRPPSAILAMSDQLALGVLHQAGELGKAVPRDLSVVGFDDVPGAARFDPPLTTVHQPHAGKGRWAGRMLVPLLEGGGVPQAVSLPTRLAVRESTASPMQARDQPSSAYFRDPMAGSE